MPDTLLLRTPVAWLVASHALPSHEVYAEVRGRRQPKHVAPMRFVPHRYFRR